MLRRLLSRLTGEPAPPRPAPAAPAPDLSAEVASGSFTAPSTPTTALTAGGAGPVFSSRAVRDATLVTGAIETLTRFVDGHAGPDEVALKLTALTPDQFSFLQISLDTALVGRAIAKADTARGPKALELRRLLDDLADSHAHPRPPAPRPAASRAPASGTAAMPGPAPSPLTAGVAGAQGAASPDRPGAAPAPAASTLAALRAIPPRPRNTPSGTVSVATASAAAPVVPTPRSVATADAADVPPPPPAARPAAAAPTLPRMSRADADARRARLMSTLTDTLSSTEASP